jgi:hypothetical protein
VIWLWTLIGIVGGLAALVGLMALAGRRLPQGHVAARRARFRQTPKALWAVLTDVEAFPSWRSDLKRIERLPDRDGRPAWCEVGRHGRITFEQVAAEAPARLVGRIADPKLPFGGTWTYEIAPADGGSTVTITERGEIYNPVFRFLARYLFGYHATLENYLKALGKKFGEAVVPEPAGEEK